MKIVADKKIPYLKGVLEPFADVVYMNGKDFSNRHIKDADAILIRTRTRCNHELLDDTNVKFIGTATIGFDHIDTRYCEQKGIVWKNAPGCNASSVGQYVVAALFQICGEQNCSLSDKALGVVGVGNVGSKVMHFAEMLGMHVYLCDPPRVRKEGLCGFISLEGILRECDIISFHVPLYYSGEDKTYHMINRELLSKATKGTYIINTSRGDIADGEAIRRYLSNGHLAGVVNDVWENEPEIDKELLRMSFIGTPHIAGYSVDGKAKATAMIVNELSDYFDLGLTRWEPDQLTDVADQAIQINCKDMPVETIVQMAVAHTYNITEDDALLRKNPEDFEKLRSNYRIRREFRAYNLELENSTSEIRRILRRIGFKVK